MTHWQAWRALEPKSTDLVQIQAWPLLAVWLWTFHVYELYFPHLSDGADNACFTLKERMTCPLFLFMESLWGLCQKRQKYWGPLWTLEMWSGHPLVPVKDGARTMALHPFPPSKFRPWLSVASGIFFPEWCSLMGLAPQKSRSSSCYCPESGCARAGLETSGTALLATSQLPFSCVRISLILTFSFFCLLFLTSTL